MLSCAKRTFATNAQVPSTSLLRMIILGAPEWNIEAVVVGDLLRQQIRANSNIGRQAEAVMKAGGLLPDEIVLGLVEPKLEELRGKHWILDGFPRKASQAVLLDSVLAGRHDELNLVVNLDVPDELSYNPPREAGRDDITGEPLTQRPDDTAEVFAKRLQAYHAENEPLLAHFAKATVRNGPSEVLKAVNLTGRTSNEITPKLEAVLTERFPFLPKRADQSY
ncbi:Adenylate kinase 2 [Microbotryomycetes sp. JL221]|nr:Adenylate kinase 2 [Microbotryomycetes sp. JL221]